MLPLEELLKQILEGQKNIETRLDNIDDSIKEVKGDVVELKQSLVRIEQEIGGKVSALFDAREVQIDSNKRMNDTLNRIEATVEKIALRTIYNEMQIRQVK